MHTARVSNWSGLDEAYLSIFGEHPEVEARPTIAGWPLRTNGSPGPTRQIVGCPVPTIDWYTRLGRIEKRPFKGPRPSLKRASVEDFATWWRDRERQHRERRDLRRQQQAAARVGPVPPEPTGWVSVTAAAAELAVTPGQVGWLIQQGALSGRLVGRRWWVNSTSLRDLTTVRDAEKQEWVSAADAGRLVGCSAGTILRAARGGEIIQRSVERQRPSLSRASVLEFHEEWIAAQQHRRDLAEQAALASQPLRRSGSGPPDEDHAWLSTSETAARLGRSTSRVTQLARNDQLPAQRRGTRYWFREDHLTLYLNARRTERLRAAGLGGGA